MNTDKIYAESIVNEYSTKQASKVVALRKLDKRAKLPSTVFAYTFGVMVALLLGVGMCLCMGQIGDGSTTSFIIGVVIGVVGILGCAVNYPLYNVIRKKGKEKYASDIMLLAKEIAEQE